MTTDDVADETPEHDTSIATETAAAPGWLATLRREAEGAGDTEQVALCIRARAGDPAALVECQRVVAAARAMGDR